MPDFLLGPSVPQKASSAEAIAGTNNTKFITPATLAAAGGGGGGGAVSSVFGRTGTVTAQTGDYTPAQVGLPNVDNTSDANKPVSTLQQAALDLKRDKVEPAVDLAGGTALTIGTAYFDTLSADRTLTFSGSADEGTEVGVNFTVTGAPRTVTFPTSYRSGEASTTTSLELEVGEQELFWSRVDGKWVLYDSVSLSGAGTGDVVGPGSSTNSGIAEFDGTTGKLLKSTTTSVSDLVTDIAAKQDSDADLTAIAGLTPSNDDVLQRKSGAWVNRTPAQLAADLNSGLRESIVVACSDETTALTTGTAKVTFRMPFAMTLTAVRASLTTAQTSGSILTVDINEGGGSILSTKLTVDNGERTSTTAVTAPVISDATLADDVEVTVDIDQIGDGTAKGLKICLIGTRT